MNIKHQLLPTLILLFATVYGANNYVVTLYTNDCATSNKFVYGDTTNTILTAVPQDCQRFARWSDGNTDNPRVVTITSDSTFTAIFEPIQYTISTSATNGTVTGGGKYDCNEMITLTALPDEGYHFTHWTDGNTDNPRQLVVIQDSTLTAVFEKLAIDTVFIYGDCNGNGDTIALEKKTGRAEVLSSAGRNSCEWVQLWENGPKWATFNVGATVTDYSKLTIGADATAYDDHEDQAPYYNTANVGGLYAWNNPNLNGRQTTWTNSVTTGICDVATTLWGRNWKTASVEDYMDLTNRNNTLNLTTWTWCDGDSIQYVPGCTLQGYKVSGVGEYAQCSIFFPAAGFGGLNTISWVSEFGEYWPGDSYFSSSSSNRDYLLFHGVYHYVYFTSKLHGLSVRAVLNNEYNDNKTVTIQAENCAAANVITCSQIQQLQVVAVPQDCQRFTRWSDGNTDNPRIVTITSDSTFTAEFESVLGFSPYFSVSENSAVAFSKGNLQYNQSNGSYKFADHQYDYLGQENAYNIYSGYIDLFAWGCGDYPRLIGAQSTFYDWGRNVISGYPANTWRTMSDTEMYYLFNHRPNANQLYGLGTIGSVSGIIILPDNWTCPKDLSFTPGVTNCVNHYTENEWTKMENAGSIFLPNAGYATGYSSYVSVYDGGTEGYYWASSKYGSLAHTLNFKCDKTIPSSSSDPSFGHAVRLVSDVQVHKINVMSEEGGTTSGTGCYQPCSRVSISANPKECHKFVKWSDDVTANPRYITVTQDSTLTAIFEKIFFNIQIKSTDENIGNVGGEIKEKEE